MNATVSSFLGIFGAILFVCGALFAVGAALVWAWGWGNPVAFGMLAALLGMICYSAAAIWERA